MSQNRTAQNRTAQNGMAQGRMTQGGMTQGGMTPDATKTRRRHVREKSVIDHLARKLFEPKSETAAETGSEHQSPTTETGLSVEEQVRKEWDPSKGGLPIFLK